MTTPLSRAISRRFGALPVLVAVLVVTSVVRATAQTQSPPPIKVETNEVVLPVRVIEERKDPKGLLVGPNGEEFHVWIYRTQEVAGLSAKSFHVYEDSAEQKIQHFSVESLEMKVVDTRTGGLKTTTGLRPVESAKPSGESAIPVVWSLAVDKFPRGTYSLEAQASDSGGNKTPWRIASFSVE